MVEKRDSLYFMASEIILVTLHGSKNHWGKRGDRFCLVWRSQKAPNRIRATGRFTYSFGWLLRYISTLRILGMSWGVKKTFFEAPGVSLGGSGVSIGGVRILWVVNIYQSHGSYGYITTFFSFKGLIGRVTHTDGVEVEVSQWTNTIANEVKAGIYPGPTVDGRNPPSQLIWRISHYLQGFIHPRRFSRRISEPSTVGCHWQPWRFSSCYPIVA